jgi:parallel beta-helix repeat protein
MLTLAFNIHPVKASGTVYSRADGSVDPATASIQRDGNIYTFTDNIMIDGAGYTFEGAGTHESKEISIEKLKILRHKIKPFEIERLKEQVGTWEDGKNYTQIINGHGTGLAPPTKDEWVKIANNTYVVDRVLLNDASTYQSSVDHTTKPWFPPIGDQDGEGSCTCWAVGYYMKTFQEAKEHNWDLSGAVWDGGQPSVEYQDRIISPDFIYHLINGGVDEGSSSYTAISLICSIGASSWEKMPYNPSDHTTWPSEEAWREAPLYRGNSSGLEWMWFDTDEGLTNLKNWIASDNLAAITVDGSKIYNGLWSLLTSKDMLTLDNYELPISLNHEVTIVGYDDNFEYTEQGQTRYGAFKIANSWGIGGFMGWENVPDGCFWISYEAMKQRVGSRVWGWPCEFYRDRIGYEPELVASFRITHSKRGECDENTHPSAQGDITVGVGSQTKSFSQYIRGGDQPFCSNNILFDITEFKEAILNVYGQQFFLEVYDGGSSTTGMINKFAVEYAESGNPPISTVNGGSVYAYVTLSPLETNWSTGKQINSDNDFVDNKVSMATDNNGYLYVAYDDRNSGSDHQSIILKRSTDGGRTWSFYCSWSSSFYDYRNPSMAIDPYDNTIYVAYEIERTVSDHDIYCEIITPTSMSTRGVDTDTGDDRYPSITCEYQYGGANWQYISYEYVHTYNDRDLMFAKSTDHGVSWSIRKLHGDFPDYNVHAQTSITNAEGYIYVAYKWGADYGSPCEIRIDRSTDFGSTWATFMDVDGSTNGCSFPSIAATHGGSTVMVAFQYDWSASNIDIRYSYSTDKGTNWVKGYSLFASGLEDEKLPALTVDGGGSIGNDVRGYFHIACKVGSYVKYSKAHYSIPYSWNSPVIVSEKWIGKSMAVVTQYRNVTAEFHPYVSWNDERTNNIYCSTVGHVHNLNNGLKYESIQEAINVHETTSGHTLLAESRTYNEMVFINKSVTLLGESWADTTIYGKSYNCVVEVSANYSVVDGFTVENGYVGISVHSCRNVTIQNNLVTDNEIGIALDYDSSSNRILQNNVTLNKWYGMLILRSPDNFLRNNSITANKYNFGVQGESFSAFIQDIDVSNMVDGKPIVFWINERNKTVPVNAGYVALVNCTQITMQSLDLANNGEGLLLAYTTNSSITENNITNNEDGICFYNSSNVTAYKNNLTANEWSGIYFAFSFDNIIIGNNIEANKDTGTRFWNSSNNFFYHNSFMNNTNQIYDYSWDYPGQCAPSINFWDNGYPSGGNYWSDYVGSDLYSGPCQNETGTDGIGDIPYVIDVNNRDQYPLIQPYQGPVRNLNTGQSYVKIQQAINNASHGDRILALSGVYYENVIINKSVTLIGENQSNTIIDGMGGELTWNALILATANNITVTGFTIRNCTIYTGWAVLGSGIMLSNVENCSVYGNQMIETGTGIWLQNSSKNNLCGNNITKSHLGILLDNSSDNILRNNTIQNGNFGIKGQEPKHFINDVDISNTIDGKPIIYLINEQNLVVDPEMYPAIGYLAIVNAANITVRNLNMNWKFQGILFACTKDSVIQNVTVIENTYGITLFESSNITISESEISGNFYCGIYLSNSSDITISGNNIKYNFGLFGGNGIRLSYSLNNSIVGNNITDNIDGIMLYKSSNNRISKNDIINNWRGVYLYESSSNVVCHNNFIGNTAQVYDDAWDNSYVSPSINVWDNGYPFGGNYWSNYIGVDEKRGPAQNQSGSDGIGDTPYVIDKDNRDNYPLMKPYGGLYDIGITNITTSKTVVGQGYSLNITITILNYGINTETFNVTAYANTTTIQTITNFVLTSRNSTTITFLWNTTGFAKGNYTISAYVWPVPGETDTAGNILTDGMVTVALVGDINADGIVDIADIYLIALKYGKLRVDLEYEPNLDINDDGIIDIADIYIAALHYGETNP